MGRIIYDAATTLNGWIADENHSLDWLFAVEGGAAPTPEQYPADAAVLVEGSHTYEWVLRNENLIAEPAKWQRLFGDKPTFVFTSRELPVPDGADVRLICGEVTDALPALPAAAGAGDIWVIGVGDPGQRAIGSRP